MNKLFSKVAALSVGLAMAIGVGVGLGSNEARAVRATEGDTHDFAQSITQLLNNGAEVPSITIADPGYTVKEVILSWSHNKTGKAGVDTSVTVGGNAFGTTVTIGNATSQTTSFTDDSASGDIVISFVNKCTSTGQGTLTISNVRLVEGSAGSATIYTINYFANGGSGTMASTSNANPTVSDCEFTAPARKTFSTWNTAADGSGESYAPGAKPGKDLDLYAIWATTDHVSIEAATKEQLSTSPWSVDNAPSAVETSSTARGWQWSGGTSAVITFTSTDSFNKVVVGASTNGDSTSLSVAVGGVAFGGTAAAKTDYTFEGEGTGNVVITATNTASKSVYINQISIYYSDGPDPSLKDMTIKQSGTAAEGGSYQWSSSADMYEFTAEDEDGAVSNVSWSVSNTSVATIKSNGRLTTVIPGSVTVYAEAEGYNKASASIEIIKGWIEELEVTGSMTKTEYTTQEQWSPAGLVATATFHSGWTENVASQATWTYDPVAPAQGVTSVVATATYDEISASSSAQAVTVTVKHAGTQDDPFTVAEARAQIDGGTDLADKYATGIVSEIVTVYSSQHLNVTFNISVDGTTSAPQLQAYREKSTYSSTVKVGDIVVVGGTLKKYGSTYEFDANCAIVSLTEPTGTKYSVIDRVDYGSLDKDEVLEGTTLNVQIYTDAGYWYPESLTVLMAGSPVAFTFENGVVTVENVQGNVSIEGTCVACNQIQTLYAKANNASTGTFYGYYVGYLTHVSNDVTYYDYIVQDGEYGIMIYNASTTEPSYTEKVTVLEISGTIKIYSGLREIINSSVAEASSVPEEKVPSAPVVYAANGGETVEYASRLTTVTGVPSVSGTFPETAGSSDITITMTLSETKTITVFYKKAAQTADADTFAAMSDAVANSEEITVKGFTSWHDGFQVQMNGYVPPVEDYTAEDFAQDLLDQTDEICVNFVDGESSYSEFKVALEAVWSDLASNDKYPSLPADQKTILAEAARDEDGTVVEQAMARYDYLTGKYDLSNFINGRTPVHVVRPDLDELTTNNNTMIIIVAIAAVSAISLAALLIVKKKKHN